MGQALYRKYRSRKLSEIAGQKHITDTLEKAIKQGSISHAYLFSGPRGVGKTSIARILAHEINGLKYDDESTHLDIIEIDAASNRRIDEIREINERVRVAPTSAKYKVYIIDEVHMLTREAFNALLKTLEEPPEHAVFILATTESHKLPETIVSRTQRFTFKPIAPEVLATHLADIAQKEKIKIGTEAIELIAKHADGSFRDALSLLDQVKHASSNITLEDVQQAIGYAPKDALDSIVDAIKQNNLAELAKTLNSLADQGLAASQLAKQLSTILRTELLAAEPSLPSAQILQLLSQLIKVPSSREPKLSLELALFQQVINDSKPIAKIVATPLPATEPKLEVSKPEPVVAPKTPPKPPVDTDSDAWTQVLAAIKSKNNTIYGIARMAQADLGPDRLVLRFAFPFHQKRLNDAKNRQLLQDVVNDITGKDIEMELLVDRDVQHAVVQSQPESLKEDDQAVKNISNIFGGAEVLE